MLRFLIIISLLFSLNSCKDEDKTQENSSKIAFYSKEGRNRLKESEYNNDFFQLANFYQPQINPLYCGIATSVILLNAFNADKEIQSQKEAEILKPEIFGGGKIEFREYLQSNFLNENTDKIKKKEIIELTQGFDNEDGSKSYDPGLTLENLDYILSKIHGLKTKRIYADGEKNSLEEFRENIKKYLKDDEHFMVVNFYGKTIGNKTGGHISPLAAYHEKTDSVLVLDVALHKDKWYFVKVEDLYKAMNTKDGEKFRGYLIVSE